MRLHQAQDDYQIDDETLCGQQANSLLELIKSGALKRKAPAQNKKAKAAAEKAVAEAAKAPKQQVCSNVLDPARSWGWPHGEQLSVCPPAVPSTCSCGRMPLQLLMQLVICQARVCLSRLLSFVAVDSDGCGWRPQQPRH